MESINAFKITLGLMEENLVIVESPAKAKTIEKFLGEDFLVKSSYGHIRDLQKKDFGIDIEHNFEPQYIISDDKKEIVRELKKLAKSAKMVWLASDEDREGEAISWHLSEVLELNPNNTKRIVFHEITKGAIENAVKNPRSIDKNLVDAQQARRVLDRLVGFELSPVLWKKVKPSLSAGRVQSVAVRLIVEREREIFAFNAESSYKVTAFFTWEGAKGNKQEIKAELSNRFKTQKEASAFLELCAKEQFLVEDVQKKPFKKSPAAPFTTSTLQQEASRKLGYSVAQTMSIAQKLYENGFITYMRTDSVNLSQTALDQASKAIVGSMGEKYLSIRHYKTKSKGAQEAHEAIRPTYLENEKISGSATEQKLYELIWKRTIASQMSDAQIEKTTITIGANGISHSFTATGEVIKFDGFLKVYLESHDHELDEEEDSALLPPVQAKDPLALKNAEARERWSQKPPRYTEASLVRKMEELGIGRPSTYAPTISTIQQREYVVREDRPGVDRVYNLITLSKGKVEAFTKTEITGAERSKLFPTDMGMVVTDFLVRYFENVVSYDFTAKVEKEFDEIAEGKLVWQKAIQGFYTPFHTQVVDAINTSERNNGARVLGVDPTSGLPISVRIGRFGPVVQIGEGGDDEPKPRFASLRRDQHLETITIEEALELFRLPREVGVFEDKPITVAIGKFGPYVKHNSLFVSLKKSDDPYTIDLERSIELIEEKRDSDSKKLIASFKEDPDLTILNGRWGAYIHYKKDNVKIPKGTDVEKLSYADIMAIVAKDSKVAASAAKAKKVPAKSSAKTSTKAKVVKKKA